MLDRLFPTGKYFLCFSLLISLAKKIRYVSGTLVMILSLSFSKRRTASSTPPLWNHISTVRQQAPKILIPLDVFIIVQKVPWVDPEPTTTTSSSPPSSPSTMASPRRVFSKNSPLNMKSSRKNVTEASPPVPSRSYRIPTTSDSSDTSTTSTTTTTTTTTGDKYGYKIQVACKDSVKPFPPYLSHRVLHPHELRTVLLTKRKFEHFLLSHHFAVINGETSSCETVRTFSNMTNKVCVAELDRLAGIYIKK